MQDERIGFDGAVREGAAPMPPMEGTGEAAQEAKDAQASLFLDVGSMRAELLLEPPVGAGRHLTEADLRETLSRGKVVYGLDDEALTRLASGGPDGTPLYGSRMVVALGTPAQDGTDGVCEERFARESEKQFTQRADGSVDYKELGLIRDVKEGSVVCEITPPGPAVDGTNVLGQPIKAREGVKAVPPIGDGLRLSEDGLRAVTARQGNLVFRDGRFVVETVYRVQNVDYDVGNITFSGDVLVNGDMMDGFEIHAGGNVTLRGQGGAVVIEAKDILIEQGMNGTGRAVLEASGTLKAGFIENCTLRVGEKITASSIINCQVECEGDVDVSAGKGVICGGKVTAFGSVKAKEIGNESNTPTTVSLGVTPKLLQERKRLQDLLETVTAHIDELTKNVTYIEQLVAAGKQVPPDRVQLLKRTQIQLPMTEKKREQLQNQLAELEARMEEVGASTLTAGVIHPPTKVSIGSLNANVTDTRQNCRVYRSSEGELVFGSA